MKEQNNIFHESITKTSLFPIIVFVIPLIMRAIPEALMGPYVLGFDTMAHYIPTILKWSKDGVNLWQFLATAPLFYTIVMLIISLGVSIIMVFKIIPPILHGLLALVIYIYARKALAWSPKKSFATALLAIGYFVALRISWDLLRNELALIFFFIALTLLIKLDSWVRYSLLSFIMIFVVLSHQLVAIIMFGVFALTIVHKIFKKEYIIARGLIISSLPAALLFLLIIHFSSIVPEYRLIIGFSKSDGWLSLFGFPSYYDMLINVISFIIYCYLPILPLVMISLRHLKNIQIKSWILISLALLLIPIVSPSNHRWVMMLTYPLSFYVSEALSKVKSTSWKCFKFTCYKAIIIYLVLTTAFLSFGFMLMPPEKPFPYFDVSRCNYFIYHMPSSMLQNTIPITDCKDTINVLKWVKNNIKEDTFLLTHRAFYGWALMEINDNHVILYEYENPVKEAGNILKEKCNQIYLIWWVNGEGWYGQPIVNPPFKEVYKSGKISIYSYEVIDEC